MNDREQLAKLFESAAQSLLEISRIMAKTAQQDRALNKREQALKYKQDRLEAKSEAVLKDLSKPHPEPRIELVRSLRDKEGV